MSRYRGPRLRMVRRFINTRKKKWENEKTVKLKLPGLTKKASRKELPPGKSKNSEDESKKKNRRPTEYRIRLDEKQKIKFNYGLTENQLFRYVKEARRRKGITGLILLQLLEIRLDTLCFTLGFAESIAQARQLVNHGHITVNKKVIDIPSFQCRIADIISVKEKSTSKNLLTNNIKRNRRNNRNKLPSNLKLKFNNVKLEATVLDYCDRRDVQLKLNELLVIEYYSRR